MTITITVNVSGSLDPDDKRAAISKIVEINRLREKPLAFSTGAQTIDKITGSVNFAAAATSLVVTNAYVTANSNIQCTIATNDATAANVKAVAGAGSFTIYLGVAPTAETRVNFTVTN